ncbi:MAG: hypothetical protein H6702_13660 [Myxococcales bacterium]|nr:hypothetical protein [Myxococcales bacterium]
MSTAALQARLLGARWRLGLARLAAWGAPAIGACGAAAALGLPSALAGAGALAAAAAALLWPTSLSAVAQRIDAVGGLEGAVECAWDNRGSAEPIQTAQRSRALQAWDRAGPLWPAPVRWPAFTLALIWIWPLSQPAPGPVAGLGVGGSAPTPGAGVPRQAIPDTQDAGPIAETAPDAGGRGAADPQRDGGPPPATADGGVGGQPTAVGQAGGTGQQAGDRVGGGPGRVAASTPGSAGGPQVNLGRGAGDRAPADGPGVGAAPLPIGRAPLDDVADPARPYPPRYQRLIGRWFARKETP